MTRSNGTHWFSLFFDKNTAAYFASFGIEYIPKKILNKIKGKSITNDTFIIQNNESIMCGFCCIAFIENMSARKIFLDYTISFSLNDYKNE